VRTRPSVRTLVVAGVALLAALVRLPGVYDRPFWEDEVASARILSEPTLIAMLHRVKLTESTPPLWYALGWATHRLAVPLRDERLLSVAFGALLAAAVVLLALRFVALPLAATAGLMVALGGEFVTHGHELRAYELLALLTCLLGLCLVRELEAPSLRREAALAAVVAAGGSTHYYFAFSAASALAWLWLDPRVRAVRRRITIALAAGGVFAAACTPIMLAQYRHDRFSWIGPFQPREVIAVPLRLFTSAWDGTPTGVALSALTVALVAIGCRRLVAGPSGTVVAALGLPPVALAAAAWLAGSNTFDLRNLIGVGPFLAIAVVAALDALPRPLLAGAAAAAVGALALSLAVFGADRLPRYDEIARTLARAGWTGRSAIAIYGPPTLYRSPLEWYLPGRPTLQASRGARAGCEPIFVVHRSGRVSFVSERRAPLPSALRRATLLVEPGWTRECRTVPAPHARLT
jgi:hypothetical protein